MGKDQRTGGPTRKSQSALHGRTPYDRPRPTAAGIRADSKDGYLVRNDQAAHISQQNLAASGSLENEPERRTSWTSWVYTPVKLLKDSYSRLSKSPIKADEVDENAEGEGVHQAASSTAAAIVEKEERVVDQHSHQDEEAGPSLPAHAVFPLRLDELNAGFGGGTPARPSEVSEGAGSSYEDIRARNITLLAKSPLAAGSPWQLRARPGSALQSSHARSSGAFGTPIHTQQQPLALSSRPLLHTAGPSRFAGLRDAPLASPLAGTPSHLARSAPRGGRPFARTPIHMQPLSTAAAPAASAAASTAMDAPTPEPVSLAWTPMRTYSSMHARSSPVLGLKRGRPDGGSPSGTPLLGAGLAADSERRIRQRSNSASATAERRAWKAGQTPYGKKPLGREAEGVDRASMEVVATSSAAISREPLPMTESARRIAMALDSMIPSSSPQSAAERDALKPSQKIVPPPPAESLGVAPPVASSAPAALSSLAWSWKPPSSAAAAAAPGLPAPSSTAAAAAGFSWPASTSAPSKDTDDKMAISPDRPRPRITLPTQNGTIGGFSVLSSPMPGVLPQATLPLTPIGIMPFRVPPALPATAAFPAFSFSSTAKVGDGAADELLPGAATPKFSFRPARSLQDSAEKAKQRKQEAAAAAAHPPPEKASAINAEAEAAAKQPLPDSADEDDEDYDDEVKGISRSAPRPTENGDDGALSASTAGPAAKATAASTAAAGDKKAAQAPAPAAAAGGWDLSFLQKNQGQLAAATAATEKEVAEAKGGKAAPAAAPAAASGGWDPDFLKKAQAKVAAATAAAEKDLADAKGSKAADAAATLLENAKDDAKQTAAASGIKFGTGAAAVAMPLFGSAMQAADKAAGAAAAPWTFGSQNDLQKPLASSWQTMTTGVEAGKSRAPEGQTPQALPFSFGKPAQTDAVSSNGGLTNFLSTIVPSSSASVFAPSTSSGFKLGAGDTKSTAPEATPAAGSTPATDGPLAPAFGVPSSQNRADKKKEDGRAQEPDGEVKLPSSAIPFSSAISSEVSLPKPAAAIKIPAFGAQALASGQPDKAKQPSGEEQKQDTASPDPNSAKFPSPSCGAPTMGFGIANAKAAAPGVAEPPASTPESTPAASAFSFGAVSQPAAFASSSGTQTSSLTFGSGIPAASAAPSMSAPSASAPLSFKFPAPSGGSAWQQADASKPALASSSQLNSSAAPFTPAMGSAFTFGASSAPAASADASQAGKAAPEEDTKAAEGNGGLEISQSRGSGRSLDSNMSISPSAVSAANANPFTTLEAAASAPAAGAFSFPASSSAALSNTSAAGSFTFGAASTAATALSSANAFAPAAASQVAFGAASVPAFGSSSAPAFGSGGGLTFGLGSAPAFGAGGSAPAFGAAGSAPATSQAQQGSIGGPFGGAAGGTGAFGASATGASTPAFGGATTPAFGVASAAGFGNTSVGAFGGAFGQQQSSPAPSFGQLQTTSAPSFGFGSFGAQKPALGAEGGQTPAAAPFGNLSTSPAWGAMPSGPLFGQQQPQQQQQQAGASSQAPFGAPAQPAFGLPAQQGGAAFSFTSGQSGGDGGSGFTLGANSGQQQQNQQQMAGRKIRKAKRAPRR